MKDFMSQLERGKVNVKYNTPIIRSSSCEDVVRASMQVYNYTHGTKASLPLPQLTHKPLQRGSNIQS